MRKLVAHELMSRKDDAIIWNDLKSNRMTKNKVSENLPSLICYIRQQLSYSPEHYNHSI